MHLNAATPAESINKTYLNRPVSHTDFGTFSDAVEILAKRVSTSKQESEAHHKTWLRDFMQQIGYKDKYTINTCQNIDLAIFDSTDSNARVSIIFETKKPGSAEMCRPTDINKKALQEALLYYLRERIGTPLISEPNLGIKNIIITDLESWYIFDSRVFESAFIGDKSLTRSFIEFEQKALSATTTDVFYSAIAKPAIQRHLDELHHTFFKLSDLAKTATSKKSRSLVAACKFLSPQNLLRLPFENIGNTLNQGFYTELLHILGLEETRTKQKRVVIQRKAEGTRHAGSMLENVLQIVVSRALITNVKQISLYGNTLQEQQLSIALQLCITWLNRILFLKLLEGQLLRYDKQNAFPHFLGTQRISNYNDLEELFFDVLAVDISARSDSIKIKFPSVPYLNSSLFELTDLEKETVSISALKSSLHLPLYKNTVLRETTGKKATGSLPLVAYLLHFLDAYDFSTSVNDNSAINNKPIISASVLGLIFEKINNYQDGAFFTPAAVTSFMCRNTVRRAALRKINDHLGWECTNIIDVYNKVDQSNFSLVDNAISNIRICDPAVGSGHFLVSALNELLCLKSELNLLRFPDGKIFKGEIVSEGDELIVTDENGDVFNYDRRLSHSQKLQELIFSQKRLLIENCLFGVDLNPTSAHICRLRLWIELLKSSYYKGDDSSCALETLPNIDINIKTGNSLIRRFKLHSDVAHTINAKTAKAAKFSVDAYRSAVHDYTHAKLKSAKRTLAESISAIKENFVEEIRGSDDDVISLSKAREEYRSINGQAGFFSSSTSEAIRKKNIKRLEAQIARLEGRISAVEQADVFKHAFEWRFEFPEILNDTGDFVGFDAIIGNPPYGVRLDKSARDLLQRDLGKVPDF
ncbi:MAG: adenine-specific DNA-methyltransferase, partial [Burkholderiales bacterium]